MDDSNHDSQILLPPPKKTKQKGLARTITQAKPSISYNAIAQPMKLAGATNQYDAGDAYIHVCHAYHAMPNIFTAMHQQR